MLFVLLEELTGLTGLNLEGTRITDAGLEDLKELTELTQLDLTDTRITDAGLKKLKEALPIATQLIGPVALQQKRPPPVRWAFGGSERHALDYMRRREMPAMMMAIVAEVLPQASHAGGGGVSPQAIMAIIAVVLVLGLVLGLLLWGMKNPLAWVVLSVVMIAIGLGCAGYGLTTLLALDKPRSSYVVEEAATFVGGGFGCMAGGVVLLVVALLRRRKRPEGNP